MMALEISLGVAFLLWLGLVFLWLWNLKGVTVLTSEAEAGPGAKPPGRRPRVSILVPARNEEAALPACLESLLNLEYPDYEIILVDDDSRDSTGAVGEEWARRPESGGRLKVIHNRKVPPGWSGKVHALALAARVAQGEWILATDADVVFHPASLGVAMAHALRERVELLSIVPEFEFSSFWERVVLPAFSFLLSTLFPIRLVNSPKSRRALAAGAFILMRAEAFRALGGYERIRRAVTEDLRTAELFKHNGHRIFLAPTRGLLRTRMYASIRELFEGLSRSAFEGVGFSVGKILAGVAIGILTAVFPWVAALALGLRHAGFRASPAPDPALALALATCALSAVIYLPVLFFLRLSPLYVFTLPLAAAFYSLVAIHSMWQSLVGRGVSWKERYYRAPE
jgi:chlorobactene glucosyltransferase